MEQLIKKRGVIKSQMTRLENYLIELQIDQADVDQIKERIEKLNDYLRQFETVQALIEGHVDSVDEVEQESERIAVENKYFNIKAKAKKLLSELTQNNEVLDSSLSPRSDNTGQKEELNTAIQLLMQHQTSLADLITKLPANTINEAGQQPDTANNQNRVQSQFKLKPIEIPLFNGNYQDWPEFFDLFKNLIHNNPGLSSCEKLQYLKKSLVGNAQGILKNLTISDANYLQAYEELISTFDKRQVIIDSYFQKIMDQEKINNASADGLRAICSNVNESVRALKALKMPVDHWDAWLIYILASKMDTESTKLWRRECAKKTENEDLKFSELIIFINNRIYELSSSNQNTHDNNKNSKNHNKPSSKVNYHTTSVSVNSCYKCQENHGIYACKKFTNLSVKDRKEFIKQKGLCFNCLKDKHFIKDCTSKSSCRFCNGKHNSLLHESRSTPKQSSSEQSSSKPNLVEEGSQQVSSCSATTFKPIKEVHSVILPTAVILIKNKFGNYCECRALLDSGSQVNLISERCMSKLKLQRTFAKMLINGVGAAKAGNTKGKVELYIKSRISNFEIATQALIINQITSNIPSTQLHNYSTELFKDIQLADPVYYHPHNIELIIGCDMFFNILENGKISNGEKAPVAQETKFGWVISGKGLNNNQTEVSSFYVGIDVDKQLKKFWEIEDLHVKLLPTEEEQQAENHFKQNYYRNKEGRYIVRLPFKESTKLLGTSRNSALNALQSMERRFEKDSNLKKEYTKFMTEYIELHHMILIAPEKSWSENNFYLPHHAVFKESTTTKLRVVFDASRKSSTGVSLNNILMVGPTIQEDIWVLLLNFRRYKIAYTADIAKMYRQIQVDEKDTPYQRVLWRNSTEEEIKEYELQTVTYGTASAPFLAIRTLKQLALDEQNNNTTASENLLEKFYVDDFIGGSDSIDKAIVSKDELIKLLKKGGFDLRKWSSNSHQFLLTITEGHRENSTSLALQEDVSVKTLGLRWNTASDSFVFEVNIEQTKELTKRSVLSEISKLYDPLGLLAPCTIVAKLIMQKIWIAGIEWDDPLPSDLIKQYVEFRKSLQAILTLKIPRWVKTSDQAAIQLCGFCDSSELAYAAAVYVRVEIKGETTVSLLVAKTKVAPIQQVSIPRLELCAAHLLSKLIKKVKIAMKLETVNVTAFTDSTIVLAWLKSIPRNWKTFVANRTSEILDIIPYRNWKHVKSSENAADPASRGLHAQELIKLNLWWNGPIFLRSNEFNKNAVVNISETQLEKRSTCMTSTLESTELVSFSQQLFNKYSSLQKLIAVTARCLRFFRRLRKSIKDIEVCNNYQVTLQNSEIQFAAMVLLRLAQKDSFNIELLLLKSSKRLPRGSKLLPLAPFIDSDGMIRVGGRIQEAQVAYNKKHPVILSKDHPLTLLIVQDVHNRYFHANKQLMVNILVMKYWIIGCRYVIKKVIRNCATCMRYKQEGYVQQMGNLPACRVQPGRPFSNTGTDYAGPFVVNSWKGRGAKKLKCYVVIFVCMATKALHLELSSDLSADKFIEALHRFTSRRGMCNNIYSDNGRNYVGAAKKLNEFQRFLRENQELISNELSKNNITWHFIPAYAPNFGGLWESSVKSMKYHLKRSVGEAILTFEEMNTLLCQVEACLNSRPISRGSVDMDELNPLTPGHFLVQGSILLPAQLPIDETTMTLSSRWQRVQQIQLSFWKRWSAEYISSLQTRKKWQEQCKNIQVDDIVLIKEDNLPPCKWLMGRVLSTRPGKDKLVRVASLKTRNGIIDRSIRKLVVLLPVSEN